MAWNHKIEIDPFDSQSIDKALKKLDEIQKQFDVKVDQFLREVAELGAGAARAAYGSSSVSVAVESRGKNEYAVVATGEPLLFLEFGAGDATDKSHWNASVITTPVYPGSWSGSPLGSKMYFRFGFWVFGGQIYHEIQPKRGMLAAYEAIMQNWQDVARRVFRQ